MSEDSGKFAEKIGVYNSPGGIVSIGTQIIQGQKESRPTKKIQYHSSVHFLGRDDELDLLHRYLQQGDYVALTGMGGVGKTELAAKYARKYDQEYGGIVWLNGGETNLAGEVIQFFSEQFGLEITPEKQQLNLRKKVAWYWNQYPPTRLPVLIICDDLMDLASLREGVPYDSRFRVLITTRQNNLDPNFIQEVPVAIVLDVKVKIKKIADRIFPRKCEYSIFCSTEGRWRCSQIILDKQRF